MLWAAPTQVSGTKDIRKAWPRSATEMVTGTRVNSIMMKDMDMASSLTLQVAPSALVNGRMETKPAMERSDSQMVINTSVTL